MEGNPLFPISNFYKGELPLIEEMKEFSGIGETRRTLQYVTLFVIALFWVYEGYRTFALYRFSLMGWGFNVLFLLLYLWRTAFFLYLCLDAQSFHYYHVWLRD